MAASDDEKKDKEVTVTTKSVESTTIEGDIAGTKARSPRQREYQKLNFNSTIILCFALGTVTATILYGLYVLATVEDISVEVLSTIQQLIVPFITGVLGFAGGYISGLFGYKTGVDKDMQIK